MFKIEYSFREQLKKIHEVTTPTQFFWMVLTSMLVFYFPIVIESSQSYTRYRKLERPDYNYESINDFWMLIPIWIALRVLRKTIQSYTQDYFISKLQMKYSGDDLEQKIEKCNKGIFKVIYFSLTFYIGFFHVLEKTSFSPQIMWGSGDHLLTFGNYPYTPMPAMVKFYYMLWISYYLEDGAVHIFQTPKYDFWEMVLHHVITAFLLFTSYMNGLWIVGAHVLPVMDFEDIWVGLIRTFMDFWSSFKTVMIYLVILTSWVYFRFIVFTYVILISFSARNRVAIDNNFTLWMANTVLLWVLQGLNVYWFFLLWNMGAKFISKKEVVDLQAVLKLKKDETKAA